MGSIRSVNVEALTANRLSQGEGETKEEKRYWALEHTKSNYARYPSRLSTLPSKKRAGGQQAADQEEAAEAFEAYQQGREHTTQEDRDDDIQPFSKQLFDALQRHDRSAILNGLMPLASHGPEGRQRRRAAHTNAQRHQAS